jgi:hypothetical protein
VSNPIDDIEMNLSLHEIGKCGATIYAGAREGGANRMDALYIVAGWFYSLLVHGGVRNEDDKDQG